MKATLRRVFLPCVILLVLCLNQSGLSQPLQWYKQFTGDLPNNASPGWDVAVDASGNVYVVGQFWGTINFGNGNVPANGSYDFFYAKYNASGALQWVKKIGKPNARVWGIGASLYTSGGTVFLYVSGTYGSTNGQILTVNFDPNNGSGGLLTMNDANGDGFVAKYNMTNGGGFVWVNRVADTRSDFSSGGKITSDASGNVYHVNTVGGLASMRKYSTGGSLLWTKSIGTTGISSGANDVSFRNNIVYAVGNGLGGTNKPLVWYDVNGNLLGSKGNPTIVYESVCSDNNGIYLAGYLLGSGTFNGVIEKYTTSGSIPAWSRSFDSGMNGFQIDIGLAGLNQNELVVAGWFKGTVNFNNGQGAGSTITSSGNGSHDNIFAVRYSSDTGNCLWVRNNPSNSSNGQSNPLAIASNQSHFYILGIVNYRTIDSDFCGGTANIAAENADNGYIAKYLIDPFFLSTTFNYDNCNEITVTANGTQTTVSWETTNGMLINGNPSPQLYIGTIVLISATSTGGIITASNGCFQSATTSFEPCVAWYANLRCTGPNPCNPLQGEPLQAEADPLGNAIEYRWYSDDQLIEITSSPVLYTHAWECGDHKLTVQAITSLGVTPKSDYIDYWGLCSAFAFYPNPASQQLNVETGATDEIGSQIILYENLQLKKVYTILTNSKKISIPLSGFNEGIYYLQVQNKFGTRKSQVLIER